MKNAFTFILCLLAVNAFAQVTSRNILTNKYSIEDVRASMQPKEVFHPYPNSVEEWNEKLNEESRVSLIKVGEELLNYKFEPISGSVSMDFARSGDRLRHSRISFAKRNNLIALAIAESIEGNGRFTEAIFNGIWSICEESYWGVPAHIRTSQLPDVDNPYVDLFAAETASVLAITDFLVGEKLDKINPLIRKRIYSETNKRVFIPMLKNGEEYGYMSKTRKVNNWNPWIMSNYMMSNLLLEPNINRRSEMLYHAMSGLDRYLNGLGDDGGCDEGPSYWFAAGGSVFDCLELLQKATKDQINIFENELIKKMGSYVYKTHISHDYFVNFADADPKLEPDGLMLYRFGKATNDPNMVEFGKWAYQSFSELSTDGFMRMRRLENLLTLKEIPKDGHSYEPVKVSWFADIEVLTARTPQGLFLATHGGHNAESHNHNDVGDFIVYLRGQPMIVDAGRGNYTARTFSSERYDLWFTQSNFHNLPVINGKGQQEGREFEASKVTSTLSADEASLKLDISKSYPNSNEIEKWYRTISLNRNKNQIELKDNYEMKSKLSELQQIFMTVCKVDLSMPGKVKLSGGEGTELSFDYDTELWSITTEYPSTEGMEYESFKTKWDSKPVTRIIMTHKDPKQKGNYSFNFVPN